MALLAKGVEDGADRSEMLHAFECLEAARDFPFDLGHVYGAFMPVDS
jgi:hypothetical protein